MAAWGSDAAGRNSRIECRNGCREPSSECPVRLPCPSIGRRWEGWLVGSREATMDNDSQPSLLARNVPWNKDRLIGQKRPLKPKDVWAIRVRLQLHHRARDLALFNLAMIASLGAAISSGYKSKMCAPPAGSEIALPSFRRKQADRSSSKLLNKPEPQSEPGFPRATLGMDSTSSRAASGCNHTSLHDSMRGSSMPGSRAPGLTARPTARIRCGGPRRRRSTRRRATGEQSSSCLDIRNSKVPSAIWASRSMTCSAFPLCV